MDEADVKIMRGIRLTVELSALEAIALASAGKAIRADELASTTGERAMYGGDLMSGVATLDAAIAEAARG